MVQKIFLGSALSVFLIFAFVLRPVPIVTEDRALVKSGTVTEIYEIGELDVVFKLAETDQRFYINRGLERGLELASLRQDYIGKKLTFKYPSYWTPLDWNNTTRHVSKVEFGEEVIFNELKPAREKTKS